MPHEFEIRHEIPLDAAPDVVWRAIAEGPGIDSWFMGRTELEPRVGGAGTQTFGTDEATESVVTAWEPGRRLAHRGVENPDGTFMAFEYLLEGRGSAGTVLRFVHSGFLGDDWESEYDDLQRGDLQYLYKLAVYLKHFPGRISAHNLFLVAPNATEERFWAALGGALGLAGRPVAGEKVTVAIAGREPEPGVVEWVTDPGTFVAVRTDDGLYMFIQARGAAVVEHHAYTPVDGAALEAAWSDWLALAFA
ncbi:SRPBCC domain-containing protein [Nonomuraea spiralis]|uniref:SRPBCC domain-containing protein n=1 Tax=Nonomuraea spiralis TaxID=46182 RepID=A0ABV5INZ6_9ACTN|nr:SRPBCC domain-containing protein [Nonomuraea spiralis]GGT26794.1 hypothetical protein GCM10010176_084310 [Nonomuraea spiralis]